MRGMVLGVLLSISCIIYPAHSQQSGMFEFPSLASDEIFIRNPTAEKVIFYLSSERTDKTEFTLAPGESASYTGAEGDTWFNIEVHSAGGPVNYGVDMGERLYFAWQGNKLDVLKMTPLH